MTQKIPDVVRIGGKNFPIIQRDKRDMGNYLGLIKYDEQQIVISDGQSEDCKKETLLHELLHAASDMTGGKIEEREVNGASKCLFAILRDNPDIAEWLFQVPSK